MPEPIRGNGGTNNTVIEQQLALLAEIQVLKFTASPTTIEPFQSTTVSYQVKKPTALTVPVTFSVNGKSLGSGIENSASFQLTSTTVFALHAATNLTGRDIATVGVSVDQSQCKMNSIPGLFITSAIKSSLDQSFQGRTTGTGSTVTLGAGVIDIQIPLNLNGQGTMSFTIEIGVAQNGEGISVTDDSVTVSIHLNTDLNVGSWCSNAMQSLVQPFMQHIVDAEIVPAISNQLMGQINGTIASAEQSAGPLRRVFVLTSFALTPDGVSYTVCPTTLSIAAATETLAHA
jgi:hypothetical protein